MNERVGAGRSILVDLDRCEGHGKCYLLAPELMRPVDDHGHAQFAGAPIDAGDRTAMQRGDLVIASCPESALRWGEEQGIEGS